MRYLQRIVSFCIAYLAAMHTAAFIVNCFGIDVSDTLYRTDWVFGAELMMTCVIKMYDRKAAPPEIQGPEK